MSAISAAEESAATVLPRLYPILDIATVSCLGGNHVHAKIAQILTENCRLLQLRAKDATPQEVLELSQGLSRLSAEPIVPPGRRSGDSSAVHVKGETSASPERSHCTLILNDRPDLALLAGFDGCHLGQEDLSIAGARRVLPRPKILGLSTHTEVQVRAGDESDADYLAIGPIFATTSKRNAAPALGLAEFARLRRITTKPVVAIGGLTRDNALSLFDAGADSVAMIGELYRGCTADNFAARFEENIRDILARIL